MTTRYFIGLHSGASLLGVDAALARVENIGAGMSLRVEHFLHVPFGNDMRELLWRVTQAPTVETRHLATLHRVLGETYALAAKRLLEQNRRLANDVISVGCPGLSFWHDGGGRYPSALHLGMMAVLAERTGLTTLSDFASRDIALGGQGAPVDALVDAVLFRHPQENRALLRLGSTASIVWLPAQRVSNDRNLLGWQAAPGTKLLDGLMRLMTDGKEGIDAGGKHAVQGRCLETLLERWLQNHFFHERPPQCVPPHEFGIDFLNRAIDQAKRMGGTLHDVLCTMTHFIAEASVRSLRRHLPETPTRILLSGRGTRNGLLWHLLDQKLQPTPLETTDAHGIPADQHQALACAGMAALTLDGVQGNSPSVTGATGQRLLGHITPGSTANWCRCLAWMARHAAPLKAAA